MLSDDQLIIAHLLYIVSELHSLELLELDDFDYK
jgi:hypothetical protein